MNATSLPPPRDLAELKARVHALAGCSLSELSARFGASEGPMLRRKGKTGQLIERALGASAGSLPIPDFRELGVELKTIPVSEDGQPRESTFVCTISIADAEYAEWSRSSVREKLSHVLFVPLIGERTRERDGALHARVGVPLFWQPTPEQESILRADFDDLMGMIAIGNIEALTARLGRWLQVRPKAAHGRVRTRAYGYDDEPIATIPRGFYLRARFTGALLRDPTSAP